MSGAEDDYPTNPRFAIWGDNQEEPTEKLGPVEEATERIPGLYREPQPPPSGEEEILTNAIASPPYILPAPPPVKHAPVAHTKLADPAIVKRSRAGYAAMVFAALIGGTLLGYLFFTLTAQSLGTKDPPQILVQKQTQTATATSYKTVTREKTIRPAPIEVTRTTRATATASQRVVVPMQGEEKTVTKSTTPQSCLNALDAADRYAALARRGQGRGRYKDDYELNQARRNYQQYSNECRRNQ